MTTNGFNDDDPELDALLRRVKEHLSRPCDPRTVDTIARRSIDLANRQWRMEQCRRAMRIIIPVASAAAGILIVFLTYWYGFLRVSPSVSFPRDVSASIQELKMPGGRTLGSTTGPPIGRRKLLLPALPYDSKITVAELQNEKLVLRTLTDDECVEVFANREPKLDRMFWQEEYRPVRVLVLWSKRPCAAVLDSAGKDGSLHTFAPGTEKKLALEIEKVLARSGNGLIAFGIYVIPPYIGERQGIQ